ncbi:Hypothetical predicted protein [Mytilus galloprovincialis]|uniref:Uncharacterized protein n=1 Tax=Mytilus galloprovincialis TaxID=29158 RepID=A0A8B6EU99_MYTGA|nr:Hypothetical predicted protein [Mytilus galloprovincialis]
MVQRRAARYVMNKHQNHSSVSKMLNNLEWRSLEQRRKDARLTMLFKIVNEKVAVTKEDRLIPPKRLSRNMHDRSFQIPAASNDYRKFSFFPRIIKDWNSLPPGVVSAPSVELNSNNMGERGEGSVCAPKSWQNIQLVDCGHYPVKAEVDSL